MCGTDFTLIARVFPNRDRDDIKRKFKTEDKANRTLVDSALSMRNKKFFESF
jgi:transcription factor TFIIIB component B''